MVPKRTQVSGTAVGCGEAKACRASGWRTLSSEQTVRSLEEGSS